MKGAWEGPVGFPDFGKMQENLLANLARASAPRIELPELKTRSFTSAEIKAMSLEELQANLLGEAGPEGIISMPSLVAIQAEVALRTSRPHWTQTWGFWLTLAVFLMTPVGLLIGYLAWRYPQAAATAPTEAPAVQVQTPAPAPQSAPAGAPAPSPARPASR